MKTKCLYAFAYVNKWTVFILTCENKMIVLIFKCVHNVTFLNSLILHFVFHAVLNHIKINCTEGNMGYCHPRSRKQIAIETNQRLTLVFEG